MRGARELLHSFRKGTGGRIRCARPSRCWACWPSSARSWRPRWRRQRQPRNTASSCSRTARRHLPRRASRRSDIRQGQRVRGPVERRRRFVHRGRPRSLPSGRLPRYYGQSSNATQEAAFEAYFRNGGGFVGVGSAVETEPGWQFLTDILGTRSAGKLGAQTVTNKVADRGHDASKNLPEYWNLNDTYYNWAANVRGLSHVLTTVSDAPFNRTGDGPMINALAGGTMGADHPVTWCKDYQGGRSYYTNHGASSAAWNDATSPGSSWSRSNGRPAYPTRSSATAVRPFAPTTSSPSSPRPRT